VIENRVGEGIATLVTSIHYSGQSALYPLYRSIVREMITASARECEMQVLESDRLRWAVYEGNKVYLLNTDYDITVKVICGDREKTVTIPALGLISIIM